MESKKTMNPVKPANRIAFPKFILKVTPNRSMDRMRCQTSPARSEARIAFYTHLGEPPQLDGRSHRLLGGLDGFETLGSRPLEGSFTLLTLYLLPSSNHETTGSSEEDCTGGSWVIGKIFIAPRLPFTVRMRRMGGKIPLEKDEVTVQSKAAITRDHPPK